jgi:RND superfamily putative drug exporter
MLLVPATMELLGDRNWWMPNWLDRIIPRLSVEGHGEHHEAVSDDGGPVAGPTPERELVDA